MMFSTAAYPLLPSGADSSSATPVFQLGSIDSPPVGQERGGARDEREGSDRRHLGHDERGPLASEQHAAGGSHEVCERKRVADGLGPPRHALEREREARQEHRREAEVDRTL